MSKQMSHREKLRLARRMNGGKKTDAFISDAWENRRNARAARVAKKEAKKHV